MLMKSATIAPIWLRFYVLITLAPLPNYVLCIGGDCRAELVIAPDGQCTDAHAFDS